MGIRKGYWTKENTKKEALKYSKRFDFYKKSAGAYDKACKNGWLDEVCFHIKPQGNIFKRIIYVYEFDDNYAYVGLTFDLNNRNYRHLIDKRSKVYKHIEVNNKYRLIQLTDLLEKKEAQEKEEYFYLKYKNDGWNMLNSAKTGALGSNIIKWNIENIKKEAFKYKSKSEFKLNSPSAYIAARKNKWLIDVSKHMIEFKKPNNYWTKVRIIEEALKYKSKSEFKLKSRGAHYRACRMNCLNEVCSHMKI